MTIDNVIDFEKRKKERKSACNAVSDALLGTPTKMEHWNAVGKIYSDLNRNPLTRETLSEAGSLHSQGTKYKWRGVAEMSLAIPLSSST